MSFGASRFTYATACQVARPPLTDRTRSPRPQRAFTSRLPAVWSPSLRLGITTTWTGLLVLAGLAPAGMAASLAAPEPDVRHSRIRLPPWMFDGAVRTRSNPGDTLARLGVRRVLACPVFSSVLPWLPPTRAPVARCRSPASQLLWRGLTSRPRASPASAHHLPDAGQGLLVLAGGEISRFPCKELTHMLGSTTAQRSR
jgi:hypothetical protein